MRYQLTALAVRHSDPTAPIPGTTAKLVVRTSLIVGATPLWSLVRRPTSQATSVRRTVQSAGLRHHAMGEAMLVRAMLANKNVPDAVGSLHPVRPLMPCVEEAAIFSKRPVEI